LGREQALKVPILYGGSVEPKNAKALMREGGVSGLLVGRASADIDSFVEILKAVR
jgi:triosephosphate isomerase